MAYDLMKGEILAHLAGIDQGIIKKYLEYQILRMIFHANKGGRFRKIDVRFLGDRFRKVGLFRKVEHAFLGGRFRKIELAFLHKLVECVPYIGCIDFDVFCQAIRFSDIRVLKILLYNSGALKFDLKRRDTQPSPIVLSLSRTSKKERELIFLRLWELTIEHPCNIDAVTVHQYVREFFPKSDQGRIMTKLKEVETVKCANM